MQQTEDIFDPENRSSIFLGNIAKILSSYTVSHPRIKNCPENLKSNVIYMYHF
jgi:hypothetical protein